MDFLTATIVCSLLDFSAIKDGMWLNAPEDDLGLVKTPLTIEFPEDDKILTLEDGRVYWFEDGDFDLRSRKIFDPENLLFTTIYSYISESGGIVTVQAHRGCIKVK